MSDKFVHIEQPKVSIDLAPVQKSHIDLSDRNLPTDFGITDDYVFSALIDDVVLVEFADIIEDGIGGQALSRGGIAIPLSHVQSAWRKGRVILIGPRVQYTKVGDIVVFPNNMGIDISNLEVAGHGKLKNGHFLNEQRIFGICHAK
jgi:hypothetical protein